MKPRMPIGRAPLEGAAPPAMLNDAARPQRNRMDPDTLKAGLKRAVGVVSKALDNPKIGGAALKIVRPDDKVGSTAKTVVMLLSEVNKRAALPERLMPTLVLLTSDEIMVRAEQALDIEYSEMEAKQVMMTAGEMVFQMYGVSPSRAKQLGAQLGKDALAKAQQTYQEALNA